jgi:hypothetical protein
VPKVNATSAGSHTWKIAYRTCALGNRLFVRLKRNESVKILPVQNLRRVEFFKANLRQIPPTAYATTDSTATQATI